MSRSPVTVEFAGGKPHPCPTCHQITFQAGNCLTCLRATGNTPTDPASIVAAIRGLYDRLADIPVEQLEDLDVCALVEDLGRLAYPDQSHLPEGARA